MSAFNAWVLIKGMETLGLRIDRHCANAARVVVIQNLENITHRSFP